MPTRPALLQATGKMSAAPHRREAPLRWVCLQKGPDVVGGAVDHLQPLLQSLLQAHGAIHGLKKEGEIVPIVGSNRQGLTSTYA